jgi:hypothetical protein
LWLAGARKPLTLRTYWSAAARTSASETCSVYGSRKVGLMCRSIKTLREPYTEQVSDADVRAAALQYVRKVSGFRAPASHNATAFEHAVATIAAATQDLLDHLEVRGQRAAS